MANPQVLARKWRPRSFRELVGQEHVVRALANALTQNRLHHAYLFTGTRGVGKTTIARILARCLNCQTGITPEPCGQCSSCREIDSGRFVDLVELDAASNTQVDQMRELLDNALYAPAAGRFKVYIIDEVHMLSKSAFNAMLKTLEEPPEHLKFILATTDPQKVPVTVLSRCLQFNLKQLPVPAIAGQLRRVLEAEEIAADAPALGLIARAAAGSMRDALSLLDQAIAFGEGRVSEGPVRAMLGSVDQGHLFDILDALARQDGPGLMAVADAMAERSLSFDAALQDLAGLLHRLALTQQIPGLEADDGLDGERLGAAAAAFAPEDVQLLYGIALKGREELPLAPDEYAGFTMTLLRMLVFAPFESGAVSGQPGETGGGRARPLPQPAPRQAAPEPRPVPVPAPAPASPRVEAAPSGGSPRQAPPTAAGDWRQLLTRLELSGMAKMLAAHCELASFDEAGIDLTVPEEHRHLLEKPYQEKLRGALRERFGEAFRVNIGVGQGSGSSPMALAEREQRERQARAVAAIEQDGFVRALVETCDARLVESSIRALD